MLIMFNIDDKFHCFPLLHLFFPNYGNLDDCIGTLHSILIMTYINNYDTVYTEVF